MFRLYAKKFDPSDIITISVMKPLGLSLEEFEENSNSGVYVAEVKDGSAKLTGKITRGLYLLTVNDKDVRYSDFDTVIDTILDAPEDQPVELSFIEPNKVAKGRASISVITSDGSVVSNIVALKGQMLRTVLLENNIKLYDGKATFTNCGGAGTCGTCAVDISNNEFWYERPQFEALRLKKYPPSARLACNTIIEGDCTVVIKPPKIII